MTGRIRIASNGRTELDLDATLPLAGSNSPFGRILTRSSVDGAICGFLIDSNQNVRLSNLVNDGGSLGGRGPIRERFIAHRCLLSSEPFAMGNQPRFRWLDLPLNGYEEWLGRGGINVTQVRRRITADYLRPKVRRWNAGDAPIELHRGLEGSAGMDRTELTWREAAFLRFGYPKADLTIEAAIDRAGRVEDLLILLADCNRGLPGPRDD